VVVAAVGAGTAAACDHNGSHNAQYRVKAARYAPAHHHRAGLLALPAAYLGLTTDQLRSRLKSGQTLAQIANATPGKSAQGLVDYVLAQAKAKLDAKVAAGKVSQAQESAWLAKLTNVVTAIVNGTWHHR
jgi:hypothetical protein